MIILALDIGDVWTGSAISDALGITANPYQTVKTTELIEFLEKTIPQKKIQCMVVGYPKTFKGTESDQTKKIVAKKELLEKKFPQLPWILWDERRTSQQAAQLQKTKTKEDKIKLHSKAAAFILMGYLDHLQFKKDTL